MKIIKKGLEFLKGKCRNCKAKFVLDVKDTTIRRSRYCIVVNCPNCSTPTYLKACKGNKKWKN